MIRGLLQDLDDGLQFFYQVLGVVRFVCLVPKKFWQCSIHNFKLNSFVFRLPRLLFFLAGLSWKTMTSRLAMMLSLPLRYGTTRIQTKPRWPLKPLLTCSSLTERSICCPCLPNPTPPTTTPPPTPLLRKTDMSPWTDSLICSKAFWAIPQISKILKESFNKSSTNFLVWPWAKACWTRKLRHFINWIE